jgi:hypothetical protein
MTAKCKDMASLQNKSEKELAETLAEGVFPT